MFGKQKTLIIDHNSERNNRIKNYLNQDHFICYQAKTLDEFNSLYTNNNYDCIILEDVFPGINTNKFLVKNRRNSQAITIVISDMLNEAYLEDLLDAGADDYIVKPFAMDELLARLRVLTRKKGSGSTNVYTLADLTVDTAARTAKRGDRTLELSAREYALLEYLIRSKGVVLSRQQIEDNLWSLDYAGGTNVVDVYISYLRKKLELPGERKLLHTVRGMGWVLKEDA